MLWNGAACGAVAAKLEGEMQPTAEDILQAGQADLIGMARELMYHADWPIHAARELGMPDHLALFPPSYAHRLVRREEARQGERTDM